MLKDPECAMRYEEAIHAQDHGLSLLPKEPTREAVLRLQDHLATLPQVNPEPVHYFAPGMYGRELAIPADTIMVGKIHRHQHITMLIKGEATINTDKGMERIAAPYVWISQVNAKRALVTHTDCVFFTCHATSETDLDKLEAELIEPETILLTAQGVLE